ncbi:hypothetical protein BKA70DRAFT_1441668 [Coprinopsis sp. MPI-PUGE-AT-0042]|nr:hypothetical protein BKA70DRAFT_1441668 [Coprinopsis sp. MPI-PUGE-AT-0042]
MAPLWITFATTTGPCGTRYLAPTKSTATKPEPLTVSASPDIIPTRHVGSEVHLTWIVHAQRSIRHSEISGQLKRSTSSPRPTTFDFAPRSVFTQSLDPRRRYVGAHIKAILEGFDGNGKDADEVVMSQVKVEETEPISYIGLDMSERLLPFSSLPLHSRHLHHPLPPAHNGIEEDHAAKVPETSAEAQSSSVLAVNVPKTAEIPDVPAAEAVPAREEGPVEQPVSIPVNDKSQAGEMQADVAEKR